MFYRKISYIFIYSNMKLFYYLFIWNICLVAVLGNNINFKNQLTQGGC